VAQTVSGTARFLKEFTPIGAQIGILFINFNIVITFTPGSTSDRNRYIMMSLARLLPSSRNFLRSACGVGMGPLVRQITLVTPCLLAGEFSNEFDDAWDFVHIRLLHVEVSRPSTESPSNSRAALFATTTVRSETKISTAYDMPSDTAAGTICADGPVEIKAALVT
jgi:hypothetical protein